MRLSAAAASVLVIVTAASLVAVEQPNLLTLPSVDKASRFARWVAADHVFEEGRRPRWHLLGPSERKYFKGLVRQAKQNLKTFKDQPAAGDCPILVGYVSSHSDKPYLRSTLEGLTAHSQGIAEGRVMGLVPGVLGNTFGSVAKIEVAQTIKNSYEFEPRQLFVFFQGGTLKVKGVQLCFEGLRPLPEIGTRLLVFAPHGFNEDIARTPITPTDQEYFLQRPDGSFSAPTRIVVDTTQPLTLDAIRLRVAELLETVPGS